MSLSCFETSISKYIKCINNTNMFEEEELDIDKDILDTFNDSATARAPSDAAVTVSEAAKFWVEFKNITRTYQDTDEVALLLRLTPNAQVMDHMFHYLSACCAFSASTDTMSTSQLHEHFYLVASSIMQTMPVQDRFLQGIFASISNNTWPEGKLYIKTV